MVKSGILLIDKPQGLTSHDVVDAVRRKFGIRRVGHSGTLDPLATGLLIILVDKATKQFNRFTNFDKEYAATLTMGTATDSGDSQGKVIASAGYDGLNQEKVLSALKSLEGKIEQTPPMVSAVKHKGKPLYKLARKGLTVERKKRLIEIYSLELLRFCLSEIEFRVRCSKGTYIRSLGEEIALRLGSCGHISQIRRISIGAYSVNQAKSLDAFNENDIRPV